jgi:hypothetical protein
MKKNYLTYLVIKCGNSGANHASQELDNVIDKAGIAWFAKFGAKIDTKELSKKIETEGVILCLSIFKDGGFHLYSYEIIGFSDQINIKKDPYPKYYKEFLPQIKTWICVKKLSPELQPSINDLIVKSSLNPILRALRTSTAGYFLCRKKN